MFAITCALRYPGGRVERKQCRLSTWTFIRAEPKTNRNPSRGHGYTNAFLPGNSILVFNMFGHLFATRRVVLFLPCASTPFELDSKVSFTLFKQYLDYIILFVLSYIIILVQDDNSMEYFSSVFCEICFPVVTITRWKRLVSSCVAARFTERKDKRRGWRGQLFGCRCSGNSGISRE